MSITAESRLLGDTIIEIEGLGETKYCLNGQSQVVVYAAQAFADLTQKTFQARAGESHHDYFKLVDVDYQRQRLVFRKVK